VRTSPPDPAIDWPLYWFAQLEAAIEKGAYADAARAQDELERLGVTVQYRGRCPVAVEEEVLHDTPS
jgi:hypothetical protein